MIANIPPTFAESILAVSNMQLILVSLTGIALILFLVIVMKLHAFVSLLLVSFIVGLAAGMPILTTKESRVVLDGKKFHQGDLLSSDNELESFFRSTYQWNSGKNRGQPRGPFVFEVLPTRNLIRAESILEVHTDHLIVDNDPDENVEIRQQLDYASILSVSSFETVERKGIIDTVKGGMGGILGFVAIVVGLGAMFGKMLEVSGGAERLARDILKKFGDDKASWAMGLTGFLISIPVFLDVGLIIIIPIVYSLSQRTGKPILFYGIPLLAGLAVSHAMIPPTPGPIAVADLMGAELGYVILFGIVAGIPAMILAGPVFGSYISKKIEVGIPDFIDFQTPDESKPLPSFKLVMLLILTPLTLILLNTIIGFTSAPPVIQTTIKFLGDPIVAMLIATLLAFYTLGKFCGYSREEVQQIATKALEPAGIIILVTGAGGVFKQVLIDSGVGQMLGTLMTDSSMPPVLLAFVVATIVRVAQGSATVAMVTGGGVMAGILAGAGVEPSGPLLGMIVISIACGATVLSHVNDSGFWLVNRFFGMSVKDTLKTWTVVETIVGLTGFAVVFTLSFFIK